MPQLIVISGASGSGKTTLCRMVAESLNYYYSVSLTTRPQRPSETDGIDYFFITRDQFQEKIRQGLFLEWAEVYGNLYGTSQELVESRLQTGQGVIVDVDSQGALAIKQKMPRALLIFISVPFGELKKRLTGRGTESKENLEARLGAAAHEEALKSQYDHVVVNRDLKETYRQLAKIITQKS